MTPNIKDLDAHFEDNKVALGLLQDLHDEHQLKLRTFLHLLYKTDKMSIPDIVRYATELHQQYDPDVIRLAGIKIHPEGTHAS